MRKIQRQPLEFTKQDQALAVRIVGVLYEVGKMTVDDIAVAVGIHCDRVRSLCFRMASDGRYFRSVATETYALQPVWRKAHGEVLEGEARKVAARAEIEAAVLDRRIEEAMAEIDRELSSAVPPGSSELVLGLDAPRR